MSEPSTPPVVRHVVLCNFLAVDDAAVASLERALRALAAECDVPGLLDLACGPATSKRGNHSYNWCLLTTHQDAASAEAYQRHPRHVAIRDGLLGMILRSAMAAHAAHAAATTEGQALHTRPSPLHPTTAAPLLSQPAENALCVLDFESAPFDGEPPATMAGVVKDGVVSAAVAGGTAAVVARVILSAL